MMPDENFLKQLADALLKLIALFIKDNLVGAFTDCPMPGSCPTRLLLILDQILLLWLFSGVNFRFGKWVALRRGIYPLCAIQNPLNCQ